MTLAGHSFAVSDRAGGLLNLRIALGGAPLAALARALGKLDGVRVTGGPEGTGSERCFLVHCPGFKLVLSLPTGDAGDFALALVSRTPQPALAVVSDLGGLLERLMSEPTPPAAPAPAERRGFGFGNREGASTLLRRSTLQPGKPLTRTVGLKRKTPLARGQFRKD